MYDYKSRAYPRITDELPQYDTDFYKDIENNTLKSWQSIYHSISTIKCSSCRKTRDNKIALDVFYRFTVPIYGYRHSVIDIVLEKCTVKIF